MIKTENLVAGAIAQAQELPSHAKPGDYLDAEGLLVCGKCHGRKEVDLEFGGKQYRMACICPCEDEAYRREQEKAKLSQRLKTNVLSGVPSGILLPGFETGTFDLAEKHIDADKVRKAKKYAEEFSRMKESNSGLLLFGPPSCGKTLLACSIANQVRRFGFTVLPTSMTRMLNEICDVRGGNRNKLIDAICSYDLLFIDDFGAERDSDFTREQLLNLVDTRYRKRLPMLITTNYGLKSMREEVDVERRRVYDRILEVCQPMMLQEKNIRAEVGKENRQQMLDLLI